MCGAHSSICSHVFLVTAFDQASLQIAPTLVSCNMTHNIFKQVFDQYPNVNVAQAMKSTKIVIVSIDSEKRAAWRQSGFWESMLTESIQIEFLDNPCCYKQAAGQLIKEVEAKFMFTDACWEKVKKDAPAVSICVSHMRALYQGLNAGGEDDSPDQTELIIIVEEDVNPEDDAAEMGIATLIANFYGNQHMSDSMLIGLTWSQHLPHFQAKKHNAYSKAIPGSRIHPYHQVVTAPSNFYEKHDGSTKVNFEFIGQGARAQAYSRKFAQEILATRVQNYWDLHVISLRASIINNNYKQTGHWMNAAYTFIEPIAFSHPIKLSERLRGSGRLQAESKGEVEEYAFFIMCDLSHQWGLSNRIQTLMWWATWASMHQSGLYVLWAPNEACNCTFDNVFNQLRLDEPPSSKLPFIKIMDSKTKKFWTAPAHSAYYCLGKAESQVEYSTARGHFAESLRRKLTENPALGIWLDEPIAQIENYKMEDTKMWAKVLSLKDSIIIDFDEWWAPFAGQPETQAAIHVRRGDRKYMNKDLKILKAKVTKDWKEIESQWSDTETCTEACVDETNRTALVLCTVLKPCAYAVSLSRKPRRMFLLDRPSV